MSTQKLSEILGEIYNKVHHLYPKKTTARLLDWVNTEDSISISEDTYKANDSVWPAYWAPSFEFTDPFQWDEQWGASTWGAVPEPFSWPSIDPNHVLWGVADDKQGAWYMDGPLSNNSTLWGGPSTWGSATWAASGLQNWS